MRSTTLGNPRPAQMTRVCHPPLLLPQLQHRGLLSGSPHHGSPTSGPFPHSTLPAWMPRLRRSPQGPSRQALPSPSSRVSAPPRALIRGALPLCVRLDQACPQARAAQATKRDTQREKGHTTNQTATGCSTATQQSHSKAGVGDPDPSPGLCQGEDGLAKVKGSMGLSG